MNNDRRAEIEAIGPELTKLTELVQHIAGLIEAARDDEQAAYDAMPEGLQGSDRGTAAESAVQALDDALAAVQEIDTKAIADALEEAAERSVDAVTIEAKAKPKTDDERVRRLPKWAQDALRRAAADVERTKADAAKAFGPPTGELTDIVVADYFGPYQDKVIPAKRVRFPAFEITAYCEEGYDGVLIRSEGFSGRIAAYPRSGNEVIVKTVPFD